MVAARLTISADDYGYSPRYNEGILEAARAGAIDAAGAMVLRSWSDPQPLLESGVEVGLHLELPEAAEGVDGDELVGRQAELFERLFGRPPGFIDGHRHRHSAPAPAGPVIRLANRLGVRVRSVDDAHRDRLRDAGVATPDRLIGRFEPAGSLVPLEIAHVEGGGDPVVGWTEWMVHPGLADPAAGSSFDREREDDLGELLRLARDAALREWRRAPSR